MSDLVKDNTNFFDYGDGLLGLRAEGELDTTRVGDNFVVEDIEETIELDVSDIVIPGLNVEKIIFAPPLLISDAADYYDQSRIINPVSFVNVAGHVLTESDVFSASVLAGWARLIFTNNLPVDIELSEIKLVAPQTSDIILVCTQSIIIRANSVDSLDLEIRNKKFAKNDLWFISGASPGSHGENVILQRDDDFVLNVDFVNIKVENITSQGITFNAGKKDSVVIGESVGTRHASFKSGRMTFDIENGSSNDLNVEIRSPHFLHKITGNPLHIVTVAEKKCTSTIDTSIIDYVMAYAGEIKTPQCVEFVVVATGGNNDGQIVTLQDRDIVKFKFGMHDVVIDEFNGRLKDYDVALDPTEQSVNLPDNLDKFHGFYLEEARLALYFYNTLEMPVRLNGEIVGTSHDGKQATLPILADINPGTRSQEILTRVVYESPANKQVVDFASLLPERIKFSGNALIGDGLTEGSLTSTSYLRTHYLLETPAYLAWNETEFSPDTTYFQVNPANYSGKKIRQDAIQLAAKDVNKLESFSLITDVENHLPVSGVIEFQLKENSSQATQETEVWLSPLSVQSAQLDINGRIEQSWTEKSEIKLDQESVAIFKNLDETPKILSLVTTMKLHGTKGEKVKVYNSDYLVIKSAARLILAINNK